VGVPSPGRLSTSALAAIHGPVIPERLSEPSRASTGNRCANPSRAAGDDGHRAFLLIALSVPLLARSFHCLGHHLSVAPNAQVCLLLVGGESFQGTQARTIFSHKRRGFVGEHALVRAGLEELPTQRPPE